jgi:hypothetical protein
MRLQPDRGLNFTISAKMSDEESQTVAVPAPKAIEEENTTTTPTDGNPDDIQQPHVNFLLRVIQHLESRLQEWFERSYPETATRKAGDYTSRSFLCLPTPRPVNDILLGQNVWWITILRSIEGGVNYLIFASIASQFLWISTCHCHISTFTACLACPSWIFDGAEYSAKDLGSFSFSLKFLT